MCVFVPLILKTTNCKDNTNLQYLDISPGSKGDGGESIYGPTFEGKNIYTIPKIKNTAMRKTVHVNVCAPSMFI